MKYERFEDLPVWQDAILLAEGCEDFLIAAKKHITYSKRDQLDRCSLSVSNNIAEGFERGSTNELLAYLYIARGSAGEVRSMLCYFERRPALRDFKSQISDLRSQISDIRYQISDIRSQISMKQHLNTLYITLEGAYLRKDGAAVEIRHDGETKLRVPLHNLEGIVTYDVSTVTKAGQKRLRQVAKTCLDYGQRVQNSVFECKMDHAQFVQFRGKLLSIIDPETDSIRIYHLGKNWEQKVEHHGKNDDYNIEGPLIL